MHAAAAAAGGWVVPGLGCTAEAVFDAADQRAAAALRDAALQDTEAWRLLQGLCTEVGARPAGSAGDAKAVAWARRELAALGLQQVRAEPLPVRVWQRGPAAATLLAAGAAPEPLVMAALGNSVAAPADGIEAEVAYFSDLAALQAEPVDGSRARGRIVFIDQKTERTRDGRGYGVAVAARTLGPVEAAKRGALALAIRSIGTDRERIAHTGATRYQVGVPRIPAFAVSVPDAERVAALHAAGAPLRLRFTLQAQEGVEATTHNVIAEIPGGDLRDEVVLISAHLDSWDLGQGAQDDGAGVAIVSAAAAQIVRAGLRPRRTIRVVLFGNEENGFDGARAYGDRYGGQVHQLVGESDFGAGLVWQMRARVVPAALPLMQLAAALLAPLGVAWPAEGANSGSPGPDAALLMRRHRWPAVQLSQDGSGYFDVHHTVHDTLDRIDPATLPPNVACWAVVAWLAAQSPLPFGPPAL